MAKSRVEKNKNLYEELELESFELEDIATVASKTNKREVKNELVEVKEETKEKKQALQPVKENPVVVRKEKKKVKEVVEEEFVIEQPISYTDKLSVEEILRAKLEKQQKLKDSKKGYKKSPITEDYTPEMMQKNINQSEGVDVRKEVNIKVKRGNNGVIAALVLLLFAVIIGGVFLIYTIL